MTLSRLHGYGADIPLLVGWQSAAGLYKVWGGARGGFEHAQVSDLTSEPEDASGAPPISLSGTRYWGGGLVGLSRSAFATCTSPSSSTSPTSRATGQYNQTHVSISGVTLAPATALLWTF